MSAMDDRQASFDEETRYRARRGLDVNEGNRQQMFDEETARMDALPQAAPPPELEALQQMLAEALNREMVLRVEIARLRRQSPKAA